MAAHFPISIGWMTLAAEICSANLADFTVHDAQPRLSGLDQLWRYAARCQRTSACARRPLERNQTIAFGRCARGPSGWRRRAIVDRRTSRAQLRRRAARARTQALPIGVLAVGHTEPDMFGDREIGAAGKGRESWSPLSSCSAARPSAHTRGRDETEDGAPAPDPVRADLQRDQRGRERVHAPSGKIIVDQRGGLHCRSWASRVSSQLARSYSRIRAGKARSGSDGSTVRTERVSGRRTIAHGEVDARYRAPWRGTRNRREAMDHRSIPAPICAIPIPAPSNIVVATMKDEPSQHLAEVRHDDAEPSSGRGAG